MTDEEWNKLWTQIKGFFYQEMFKYKNDEWRQAFKDLAEENIIENFNNYEDTGRDNLVRDAMRWIKWTHGRVYNHFRIKNKNQVKFVNFSDITDEFNIDEANEYKESSEEQSNENILKYLDILTETEKKILITRIKTDDNRKTMEELNITPTNFYSHWSNIKNKITSVLKKENK